MRKKLHISVLGVAAILTATGLGTPARADHAPPVPDSCSLHPTHVVNPGCAPALESELREPSHSYPNIVPDVQNVQTARPFVFDPETGTVFQGPLVIQFDGWVQNTGRVPLELMADDPTAPTTVMQCVAWTTHVCRESTVVGEYAWHDEHGHYHFQDFADYQLRRLGPDGRPDYSDAGLISMSEKVSYCLVDSSLIDTLDPAPPFYVTCGSALMGVSPKWSDVYSVGTPGQELSIDGLPDGRYALIVSFDYANRLLESDDTDNVVEVTVEISGNGTAAAIVSKHRP